MRVDDGLSLVDVASVQKLTVYIKRNNYWQYWICAVSWCINASWSELFWMSV